MVQRTSRAPLFAAPFAWILFFGWQLGLIVGVVTLFLGINTGKEYAEFEWPLDLAIAALWVLYAVLFFGTLANRTIRPIYIANWFFGSLIIVVAMLHIVNSMEVPVSLTKSYSLYAGSRDAIVQWWYGHNAVGFLLTGGFLGFVYYFLPKMCNKPAWSYRLSIISFWTFVFTYIWAGPHHLHYSAIPDWVQALGMVMSVILLLPSWGTMINGFMTAASAWDKVMVTPGLKFIVLALVFYGLATFEGPFMAIKTVNVVSHFTDWTIGHVHSGALGWNAFVTFGALYYLIPALAGRPLHSIKLANWHLILGVGGILIYIFAMWGIGITQGLLLLQLDDNGELSYSFNQIMRSAFPFYFARLIGGIMFLVGVLLMIYNFYKTTYVDSTADEAQS